MYTYYNGYIGLHPTSHLKFGDTSISNDKDFYNEEVVTDTLRSIKKDLLKGAAECSRRKLKNSAKWCYEMLHSLKHVDVGNYSVPSLDEDVKGEIDDYNIASTVFDHGEYDRAAFFTCNTESDVCRFLHYYARYCSGEKKKNLDDAVDPLSPTKTEESYLWEVLFDRATQLNTTLNKLHDCRSERDKLSGYDLWLFGIIQKKLDQTPDAVISLCEAIRKLPYHWGAWLELASLIDSREMLETLLLPDHWMKKLFLGHIYIDLHLNEEATCIYSYFEDIGLGNTSYIKSQIAFVHHNQKDVDTVIKIFREIEAVDPFRLENIDMYSNILYVKEMRVELAYLAHKTTMIDKYRMETCCVVGNYYSLRGQHEKAVQYFQRALKINPRYLSGWTLMGHEYIEMKNTNAAIHCYRQAVEVNKRDYRAWYGLGQTYEVLKLPSYSIYYYKQAHRLHPNDSRNLIALGECYDRLDKTDEAKKCFYKAHSVGDIEDLALIKLAKLYEKLNELDRAAAAYSKFLDECPESTSDDKAFAYLFLARYHLDKNELDIADEFGHKCVLCPETREEGKGVLKEIAAKRKQSDDKTDIVVPTVQTRSQDIKSDESMNISDCDSSFDFVV